MVPPPSISMLDIVVIYPRRPSGVQWCQRHGNTPSQAPVPFPIHHTGRHSVTKRRGIVTAGILAMVTVTGGLVEAQNPATVSVLRARADSLARQRSFDAPAGLYRQILERDSTQIGAFMGLGRAKTGCGQASDP